MPSMPLGRGAAKGTSTVVSAMGVAVNATAATGSMHLMLLHLPNCFTLGEEHHPWLMLHDQMHEYQSLTISVES